MISVIENTRTHNYEISFKYDPALIEHIKQVPGRRWVPETKIWTIPSDKLGWFINEIRDTKYESQVVIYSSEKLNKNEMLESTSYIPDIDISKVPFYICKGSKPYQHQLDTLKFAIDRYNRGNHNGFILADEPGLGKTASAMNIALYGREHWGFQHCLIICCVNGAKYNWVSDIIKHTDGKETPYLIGSRLKRDGVSLRKTVSNQARVDDMLCGRKYGIKDGTPLPFFLVVNIEAFRYHIGKVYPFADAITKWINDGLINMVVLDEVHKNMSPSSAQGKRINKIKQDATRNIMWMPMTGTPITNKPTDVYLPLKLVNGHNYTNYHKWCENFCVYGGYGGHDIVSYKNIDKLKQMLQDNMLRRLKDEVLDLPPKLQITEYVENTSYQNRLYNDVADELIANEYDILNSFNPLTKFLRLRQVNGSPEIIDESIVPLIGTPKYLAKNAKLVKAIDIVSDILERGEKVIIFSNWVEPLKTLYKYVSRMSKVCCVIGSMDVAEREKHKQVFNSNPDYKIMLGTIGAMGTSHTLTASNNVIFFDEPWTPADKLQSEDRVHRIGATKAINIYTIISVDTVDDRVHDILYEKSTMSNYIVDDKLDLHNNPALLSYIMQDSLKRKGEDDEEVY